MLRLTVSLMLTKQDSNYPVKQDFSKNGTDCADTLCL